MDFERLKLILDTNALSAVAEGNSKVLSILAAAQRLALPVIVIGEYRYGIGRSLHSARYQQWLEGFIAVCDVFDVTEQTARFYAAISTELRRVGKPIPANDLWIAALSRQHGQPILSQDHHFDFIEGIERIDW